MTTDFSPLQFDSRSLAPGGLRPVGTDIAFNFATGDVVLSGSDILTVRRSRTVGQWVMSALMTEQGDVPGFGPEFGSRIKSQLGGIIDDATLAQLVRDAIIQHDRVVGVHDIIIDRSERDPETVALSFAVEMDWGERIVFRRVGLG